MTEMTIRPPARFALNDEAMTPRVASHKTFVELLNGHFDIAQVAARPPAKGKTR